MLSIKEQKNKLRSEIKNIRDKTSIIDYQKKNDSIKKSLISFVGQQNVDFIHSYLSMNHKFEVDTLPIINRLFGLNKKVAVPIMVGNALEHSQIFSLNDLQTNSWGVLEPVVTYRIDIDSLDLVIVPLLGVDLDGNRLGYGKGFYDRFLKNTKALKIGLCFHDFIFKKVPTEQHDVKLDGIITEKGIRFCN